MQTSSILELDNPHNSLHKKECPEYSSKKSPEKIRQHYKIMSEFYFWVHYLFKKTILC